MPDPKRFTGAHLARLAAGADDERLMNLAAEVLELRARVMDGETIPTDAVQRQLHYLITVQWNAPNGSLNVATNSGVTPADGRTREQTYEAIFAHVTAQQGAPPQRTSVLFFGLEPNRETDRA